jgi:hypothetical protein
MANRELPNAPPGQAYFLKILGKIGQNQKKISKF